MNDYFRQLLRMATMAARIELFLYLLRFRIKMSQVYTFMYIFAYNSKVNHYEYINLNKKMYLRCSRLPNYYIHTTVRHDRISPIIIITHIYAYRISIIVLYCVRSTDNINIKNNLEV